jgi:hypothetical protein
LHSIKGGRQPLTHVPLVQKPVAPQSPSMQQAWHTVPPQQRVAAEHGAFSQTPAGVQRSVVQGMPSSQSAFAQQRRQASAALGSQSR